ncbi:hypothetical protein Tco_0919684 [Tanacetum coccineum]
MINFIDIACEDRFPKELKLKKSNHLSSGSTTPHTDYSLSDYDSFYFDDDRIKEKSSGSTTTHFDFSLPKYDSFIFDISIDLFPPTNRSAFYHEEFADELAFLDPFPPGNKDNNFDPEADLRKIEYLLNRDPSTESSPKSDIKIIDPILERFTDEPALVYSLPLGEDDDEDDDLFDLKSDNDEWKKFLCGDSYKDIDRENSLFAVDEPFLLDTPPPGSKLVSLEEEENFDPFLSLIRSEMMTRMADIPSLKLNEDECFDPGGGEIDVDIPSDFKDDYYNSEGEIIYLESLFNNDIIPYLPPEVFLEHVLKNLNDEPNIDDLKIKENVRFTFEDRHYLSLTFIIKIFLPFLTYLVNSLPFLSSRSEDTIFDAGISAYSFYSLEPVTYEFDDDFSILLFLAQRQKNSGRVKLETRTKTSASREATRVSIFFFYFLFSNKCDVRRLASSFLVFHGLCFMFRIAPDYEDSRARGFVHRSLKLQSLACLYMGIRYPRSY